MRQTRRKGGPDWRKRVAANINSLNRELNPDSAPTVRQTPPSGGKLRLSSPREKLDEYPRCGPCRLAQREIGVHARRDRLPVGQQRHQPAIAELASA